MAVTLFTEKYHCSGCGACLNACGRNAITMQEDEFGFRYPVIDEGKCIGCGACQWVCGYQNLPEKKEAVACFGATAGEDAFLERSSSGGVFARLAKAVLNKGGIVYGAAMPLEQDGFTPKHMRVDDEKDLHFLQGSKYVQSDTGVTFSQAREDLKAGLQVLYSGTPCQIAGLRKFLSKEYDNLLTAEVICHGVPSAKMFRDFIKVTEENHGSRIKEFAFRSKKKQQSMCAAMTFDNGEQEFLSGHRLSYMHYFLNGLIYRDSCYRCPFATEKRVADITLGDFWGFHEEYPEEHRFADSRGISCVLIHTSRGATAFAGIQNQMTVLETDFEKIARHNAQLRHPTPYSRERDVILSDYRQSGYRAVEDRFQKNCPKERMLHRVIGWIPPGIRRQLKRMKGQIKKVKAK